MGSSFSQVSQSTQPQSKSGSMPQFPPPTPGQQSGSGKGMAAPNNQVSASVEPQYIASETQVNQNPQYQGGKGGGNQVTPSASLTQGQQPKMGMPNNYPNTVGQWDNASIQPQQSPTGGGKGKG